MQFQTRMTGIRVSQKEKNKFGKVFLFLLQFVRYLVLNFAILSDGVGRVCSWLLHRITWTMRPCLEAHGLPTYVLFRE